VNAHFSLLPSYRGAAPVQWALINGERHTGVSIMVLSEGMDEGPLLASEKIVVEDVDTAASLEARLALRAAPLLVETIHAYAAGSITPHPQDEREASYAPKLEAEDVRIDWTRPARDIRNLVRGADPQPGAWTMFRGKRLKILRAGEESAAEAEPGVLELTRAGLQVGTGEGSLLIDRAQMQGRRALSGVDLGRGLHLQPGDRCE
jgi:methionyl-tRNA formyltransferase